MWLSSEKQVFYRATLLFSLSVLFALILNISTPVWSVLIVTPIVTMSKFKLDRILISIIKQIACLTAGMIIAEIFYHQFFMMWLVSALFVYFMISRAKYHENSFILMALFFFFSFGLVKTTEGIPVENTIYSMVQITFYVVPLAWFLFTIFPENKTIALLDIEKPKTLTPITQFQCIIVTMIISIVNLVFMLVTLESAIFCIVVINAALLTFNLSKLKQHIGLIIPIQVGGCIIGLIMNAMLLRQGTNILWTSLVIVTFSFLFIYAHFNPKYKFKSIYGYEISLLRATFIPFTLYSESHGFNPESYLHRSYDMLVTLIFLTILWKVGQYFASSPKYQRLVNKEV
ncbi:hypothetical protein [Vibrio algivorus]|uniref:DUF2955 domain-containing protein n=1 Tax=Vibrio algivorus TaxID=1667024 RepID=A0A557NUY5_9VIBR|nr:hypothetical protein [Vibrio algivorus]TVO32239.1 hypothetical protein FOF44_17230 [Vibrio algivorus]